MKKALFLLLVSFLWSSLIAQAPQPEVALGASFTGQVHDAYIVLGNNSDGIFLYKRAASSGPKPNEWEILKLNKDYKIVQKINTAVNFGGHPQLFHDAVQVGETIYLYSISYKSGPAKFGYVVHTLNTQKLSLTSPRSVLSPEFKKGPIPNPAQWYHPKVSLNQEFIAILADVPEKDSRENHFSLQVCDAQMKSLWKVTGRLEPKTGGAVQILNCEIGDDGRVFLLVKEYKNKKWKDYWQGKLNYELRILTFLNGHQLPGEMKLPVDEVRLLQDVHMVLHPDGGIILAGIWHYRKNESVPKEDKWVKGGWSARFNPNSGELENFDFLPFPAEMFYIGEAKEYKQLPFYFLNGFRGIKYLGQGQFIFFVDVKYVANFGTATEVEYYGNLIGWKIDAKGKSYQPFFLQKAQIPDRHLFHGDDPAISGVGSTFFTDGENAWFLYGDTEKNLGDEYPDKVKRYQEEGKGGF